MKLEKGTLVVSIMKSTEISRTYNEENLILTGQIKRKRDRGKQFRELEIMNRRTRFSRYNKNTVFTES